MSNPSQALSQRPEGGVDFRVDGDVARHRDITVKAGRHFLHPRFELVVLVRERQLGTFAMHGFRNAVGDRSVTCESNDQRPLAG